LNVSYAQLTDLTNMSYRTLRRRFLDAGLQPVARGQGPGGADLWDSAAALKSIFLGAKDDLDARAEKARLDRARADYQEMRNAELQGELVSQGDINAQWFAVGRQIRDSILSIPDRISAQLAAEDKREVVHKKLMEELRRALFKLVNELN